MFRRRVLWGSFPEKSPKAPGVVICLPQVTWEEGVATDISYGAIELEEPPPISWKKISKGTGSKKPALPQVLTRK